MEFLYAVCYMLQSYTNYIIYMFEELTFLIIPMNYIFAQFIAYLLSGIKPDLKQDFTLHSNVKKSINTNGIGIKHFIKCKHAQYTFMRQF